MVNNAIKVLVIISLATILGCEKDNDVTVKSSIETIEKEINAAHITSVNTWNLYGNQTWTNWFATNAYAKDGFLIIPESYGIKTFNLMTANLVEVDSSIVNLWY